MSWPFKDCRVCEFSIRIWDILFASNISPRPLLIDLELTNLKNEEKILQAIFNLYEMLSAEIRAIGHSFNAQSKDR